jgi:hypothetical protein
MVKLRHPGAGGDMGLKTYLNAGMGYADVRQI